MSHPLLGTEDPSIIHESWAEFGKRLEDYISHNRERLEKESFDIILGFSRGGIILAFAFACLLKDGKNGIEKTVYSNPTKASVRPIPRGLIYKMNDHCFVMNQGGSKEEIKDIIENLRDDLEYYSRKSKVESLNVLIMDDNLTGATRIQFLDAFLEDMKPVVEKHSVLAYVRHKAFPEEELQTIREFPEDKNIFVMPWHVFHKKRVLKFPNEALNLTKLRNTKLKLYFEMIEELGNLDGFKSKLAEKKYFRLINRCGRDLLINGASEFPFRLNDRSRLIEFKCVPRLVYPPKGCLEIENGDGDGNIHDDSMEKENGNFIPFCSLINKSELMGATCLVCVILNCNRELFDSALNFEKSSKKVRVVLESDNEDIRKLNRHIEEWLKKSNLI